jgi:hypothetical protein
MEYEMTLVAKQQVESFFNQTAHELGFRLAVVLLCMAAGLSAQSTNQARQSDKLRLGLYSAVPARFGT